MSYSLRDYLAEHRFAELFLDELGWDAALGSIRATVDGDAFEFAAVAQKRGLLVLRCQVGRVVLANRGLLRLLQKKASAVYHEHILIYSCERPRKQVWQWAVRGRDGRGLKHREHPFFSASPPPEFVDRLEKLRFTLNDEERATLLEALGRVRRTLDREADLDLFAHKPSYAKRSDELALAMRAGVPGAREAFLEMHLPFVRWVAKKFQPRFGIELDDVHQTCAIGLLLAAQRFDPELGFQFSTYAFHSMRRNCERRCTETRYLIRFPVHVVPICIETSQRLPRLFAAGKGPSEEILLRTLYPNDPVRQDTARTFLRARNIGSISRRSSPEYRQCREVPDPLGNPQDLAIAAEHAAIVRSALAVLYNRRGSEMVSRWYGLNGPPETLETIGQAFHVTRERARQIIKKTSERLRNYLEKHNFFENVGTPTDDAKGVESKTKRKKRRVKKKHHKSES